MAKGERWGKKFEDTRNWKVYHEELIIRGEFFFDFSFLENWDDELLHMNKNKVGRPYEYPDSLFVWLSPMHNFLDSRKLEGAMHKLSHYIPRLRACDHSTIIERLNKLEQNLDIDKSKKYHTAVDVTGNKLSNRGEYIRHKWKVKRGWIKVSLVIDRFTKELLDVQVSLEDCADYELAKKHLAHLQDVKIEDLAGDGAYYVEEFYKLLQKYGIRPVIKMPKNASPNGFDQCTKLFEKWNSSVVTNIGVINSDTVIAGTLKDTIPQQNEFLANVYEAKRRKLPQRGRQKVYRL